MTEHEEQPLCPSGRRPDLLNFCVVLLRLTWEGQSTQDRYFWGGGLGAQEQLVLVVHGQFPSWGILCWLVWTVLGSGVWGMYLFVC